MRVATLPLLLFTLPVWAQTVPAPPPSRGQLLYGNHCVACHNTQMHWRDQRLVKDFDGLLVQVRAWQAQLRLDWSETDVLEVARHLDRTIYQLPRSGRQQG